ncbi:MAG: hypothetical protein IPK34_09480 [Ramlibacter sp.]|nr:hypothetical protein [Ramlibacter sp.]
MGGADAAGGIHDRAVHPGATGDRRHGHHPDQFGGAAAQPLDTADPDGSDRRHRHHLARRRPAGRAAGHRGGAAGGAAAAVAARLAPGAEPGAAGAGDDAAGGDRGDGDRQGVRAARQRAFRRQPGTGRPGLANLTGSFFSSYPASGSFNRSGVNVAAGARTPLAAVSAAVLLIVILSLSRPGRAGFRWR